jgi:hypothetical protein
LLVGGWIGVRPSPEIVGGCFPAVRVSPILVQHWRSPHFFLLLKLAFQLMGRQIISLSWIAQISQNQPGMGISGQLRLMFFPLLLPFLLDVLWAFAHLGIPKTLCESSAHAPLFVQPNIRG